ncbi:transporter substrate-binding domain-containing protein [Colwellia sp. MSW7]|uniref:Transporter substrate-binding domain-containing protein n=1 Tax=Colwellia maritima TaxID=2912588 RepID=A0ABS9X1Z2_9GAMM|nr:transporter substrate-binding domain-containing protein [Colwellia maritima]MCI2284221.1 transporter substrate-binding domain-containing protein [Colwellia maritima]
MLNCSAQSQEFSVGWELWYPYQYHNEQNKLTGVDIELFKLITENVGMSVSYVELPWQRHLMYIKSGNVDIAFGASYTKERAESAYYSIPYRKELVNLFVRKGMSDSIKLSQLSDLIGSKYLIGIENGYYYGKEYEQLKTNPDFISRINSVIDIEQNVKMLMKGHIDGFLADPMSIQSFVEKYKFQDEFEVHPLPIYQGDIFIMLSKKTCSQTDLDKINDAIISLKENGKLDQIINHWSIVK